MKNTKKPSLIHRSLRIESLENREMLSISPLGDESFVAPVTFDNPTAALYADAQPAAAAAPMVAAPVAAAQTQLGQTVKENIQNVGEIIVGHAGFSAVGKKVFLSGYLDGYEEGGLKTTIWVSVNDGALKKITTDNVVVRPG